MREQPSVTGVLVTGKTTDRYPLAKKAVDAWVKQDYQGTRKLLIINDHPKQALYSRGEPPAGVHEVRIAQRSSLGDLRNQAIEIADTEYIVQWDDDDYSHPSRLSWQIANTPRGRASIFKWEIHCNLLTGQAFANNGKITRCHGFAGTMLWPADAVSRFPDLGRHEDTEFVLSLRSECGLEVLKNDPKLYFRCYHGHNTWSQKHVMKQKPGSRPLTPAEKEYVNGLLQKRYPKIIERLKATAKIR